jgi:arylsulfatase A
MMKLITLAVVLATLASAAQKPNIVYILCDDLGYGDVQCLNPERGKIPTPNIDKLAKAGMIFTDTHGGSSVCTPTRYGILTGRYCWRSRLQNGVMSGYDAPLIAADRLTVASLLKQHGYATACIGKWHLGFTVDKKAAAKDDASEEKGAKGGNGGAVNGTVTKDGPVTRGFDHFYGFHHARMMQAVFTDDTVTEQLDPTNMLPALTRRAVRTLEENAATKKPFFLYLALNSPHTPIVPAKEWQGKSGLGAYGDFVMQTDWTIGQVLEAIDKAGITQDTLVIFTSDNGCSPAAGFPTLEKHGHYPSAQFRGHKADIWDGGHRIPFIVRWPGVVKPASSCAQLTCLTDLMATCAEIVGAKLPDNAGEDSFSILPLLKGEDKPVRETLIHHSINGLFALRNCEWKLELCAGSGGWSSPNDAEALKKGLHPIQLYNMLSDYMESKNVEADNKAVVEAMTAQLTALVENGRSTPGAKQANDVKVTIVKTPKEKKRK